MSPESPVHDQPRWRMGVAAALVLLFAVLLAAANHAVWLGTTVVSTDQFVNTFAPLPQNPAVATALGTKAADSIVTNNDVEQRIMGVLPDGLGIAAVPITNAIEGLIADVGTDIIASDAFEATWRQILTTSHRIAEVLIKGGDRGVLVSEDGEVSLDLAPLVDQLNQRLLDRGIDVLDGREVDASFVLFNEDDLGIAQSIAEVIYDARWIAPIAVLLLLIGAIAVATDRRRVIVWLGTATAITSLLMLIEIRYLRATTVSSISDPTYKDGAEAAWSIIFNRLIAQTWALLLIGLIVIAVAWFVGPSERAVSLRSGFSSRRDTSAAEAAPLTGGAAFVSRHARALQWIIVILGGLFLLWVPAVTVWTVLITVLLVVGIFAVLEWIGAEARTDNANGRDRVDSASR